MLYIFGLFAKASFAAAVTLQPAPTAPNQGLPFDADPNAPVYSCAEVYQKLADYSNKVTDYNTSITNFLTQVGDRANNWYSTLQPLEGKTQTIEAGTFNPLKDDGDQIANITNLAYDNNTLIGNELGRIMASLQPCLPQNQPQPKKTNQKK